MRILMTSWAWPAHYLPLVPLGLALRTAGHEVVVAGQPTLEKTIRDSGLTATVVGEDLDSAAIVRSTMGLEEAGPGADPARVYQDTRAGKGAKAVAMFATFADAMADDLVEFATAWQPDLIVYETTSYAGALCAEVLGIPAVRHPLGLDFTYAARAFEPDALAGLWRRFGLGTPDMSRDLTLDPCPPTLQIERDLEPLAMRYIPSNGSGVAPAWVLDPPARPRVCLTWGTSLAALGSHLFIAGDLMRELSTLDVEVVVAITAAQRELLGEVPDGVRILESVPLHLVLPHCSLLVHQGGQGTTLTAATMGVPQLVIPQMPDQMFMARRTGASGAARVLLREELLGDALCRTVRELLDDPAPRAAAGAIRDENARRPLPVDVVPALVEHARGPVPAAGARG